MNRESKSFTRKELYDLVWAKPLVQLAEELGLSDVGLAKRCRKAQIPLPGIGYWRKKETGKKVRQEPLRNLKDNQEITFWLPASSAGAESAEEMEPKPAKKELPPYVAFEKDPANKIVVSDTLDSPHKFVAWAQRSLRNAPRDERGILMPRTPKCLEIRVTKDSLTRALLIMDALLNALEERDIPVKLAEGEKQQTVATVDGEELSLILEEAVERQEKVLTAAQKRQQEERPWLFRNEYDYCPTGQLVLRMESSEHTYSRKSWRDGKLQRVEQCLNSFIRGMHETALRTRLRREERDKWNQEWEEKRRRREELQRLQYEEQNKLKKLEEEVTNWHKAQRIREYVEAIKRRSLEETSDGRGGKISDEYIEWALRQADRFDPLKASPPSVLDEPVSLW